MTEKPRDWQRIAAELPPEARKEALAGLEDVATRMSKTPGYKAQGWRTKLQFRLRSRAFVVALAVATMLFAAAFIDLDGFYSALRLGVSLGAFYIGYEMWRDQRHFAMLFSAAVALFFQPLVPVDLSREDWRVFDFLFGVGFLLLAQRMR